MTAYDLVIAVVGSGNTVPDDALADWKIAIVEVGRASKRPAWAGCIPSKMPAHTADVASTVRDADRFGGRRRADRCGMAGDQEPDP